MRMIKWLNNLIEYLKGWMNDLITKQLVIYATTLKQLHDAEKTINARTEYLKELLEKNNSQM